MSDRSTILDLVQRIEALSPEARATLFAELLQRQYARNGNSAASVGKSVTSAPSGEPGAPRQSSPRETETDGDRALSYLEKDRRELDLETEDLYR